MGIELIDLCWKSLMHTLFSIQSRYYDLEHTPLMLSIVDRNTICTHNIIPNVINVNVFLYIVWRTLFDYNQIRRLGYLIEL